ncbi:MAG: hypothetical protein WCQ16_11625 [Verrucomicrobiae bacterium]
MKTLTKALHRIAESAGNFLRRLAQRVEMASRKFETRTDRRRTHKRSSDWKRSASLWESLRRLAKQVYKNLRNRKRRNLKTIVDVCVMALESPVVHDAYMADQLRVYRLQKTGEGRAPDPHPEEKKERIQLPPRKSGEETESPSDEGSTNSSSQKQEKDKHIPVAPRTKALQSSIS